MEEKIESNHIFQLLEGDDDILLFGKDTFTVGRFRELLTGDFAQKNGQTINTISHLNAGTVHVRLLESKWNSTLLDCQFLKIGSKGWEKGKIRIKVSYEFENNIIRVRLEFSPDEPPQPESPLDDLRELPEYKQQL
jgi:hypothetical protein